MRDGSGGLEARSALDGLRQQAGIGLLGLAGLVALTAVGRQVEAHWPGGTAGGALKAARQSVVFACSPHPSPTMPPPVADVSFPGGEKVERVIPAPSGLSVWRVEGYVKLRTEHGLPGEVTVPYAVEPVWQTDGRFYVDHLDLGRGGYAVQAVFPR